MEDFAWNLIASDDDEWDDELIADILFEWDNEEMNFPINKVNMQLWKMRLITGTDRLAEHNIWNVHIEKQKFICMKYGAKWAPVNKKWRVGVSGNLTADPVNGLRRSVDKKAAKGTSGWFIWTGGYSDEEGYFKPICAEHLLQIRPEIIRYLGLDAGFRFLADSKGYEDVWYDGTITKID